MRYCEKSREEKLKWMREHQRKRYRTDSAYRERRKKEAVEWQKNNPERTKQIRNKAVKKYISKNRKKHNFWMMEAYNRHKDRWHVRASTYYHREEILKIHEDKCDECGSKKNLEIHHYEYKWEKKGVKGNLYLNLHRIGVLCLKCHETIEKQKLFK